MTCAIYLVIETADDPAMENRLRAALEAAAIPSVLFLSPDYRDRARDAGGAELSADDRSGRDNDAAKTAREGAARETTASETTASESTPSESTGAAYADLLRPLIALAQDHDAAALLLDDPAMAKSLGADGVHLGLKANGEAPLAELKAARASLLTNYIAGAEAGAMRDAAMQLGEAGADYVAFSRDSSVTDKIEARDKQIALISWWAEIFEVPCVGFDADTPEDAAALRDAGADFVALHVAASDNPADITARVTAFAAAINPPTSGA